MQWCVGVILMLAIILMHFGMIEDNTLVAFGYIFGAVCCIQLAIAGIIRIARRQ